MSPLGYALLGAAIVLIGILLITQMRSRREIQKLRMAMNLVEAQQESVITQSRKLREQMVHETEELNKVLSRFHNQNSQNPTPV